MMPAKTSKRSEAKGKPMNLEEAWEKALQETKLTLESEPRAKVFEHKYKRGNFHARASKERQREKY